MKFKIYVLITFACVIIASCKKGNDDVVESALTTDIDFVNASTDTINYYVNGTRLNRTAASYPLGSTGYLTTPLGEQNYQVKKDRTPNVLFNLALPLDADKVYSFFVTDNKAENAFKVIDTITKVDTLTMIRFAHTSPQMADIDVQVGDTVKFNSMKFKAVSDYQQIRPGIKHIKVIDAVSGNVLIDEIRTLELNRAYTLFTKGTLTNTGSKATSGTGLIINL